MKFVKESRRGIASKLHYYCDTCGKAMYLDTHPDIQTANELLVWGSLSVGIGYSQSQELLAVLNIPNVSSKTFSKHERNIEKKWEDELYKQMKNAAEEEKAMAISEGNLEDGVPFITVVVDGGQERLRLLKYKIRRTMTRKRHVVQGFNDIDTDYSPNAQEALPDLPEVEVGNRKQKILLDLENSAINRDNIEKATKGQH
ncbi:hypothetical protein ILUMI_09959 [Ignelater luminosus]|uniref:Mutator-like transposase domain-containing protein n=1 Tax=Ignelater luminosus TaxID=2038154 RepID=A0A8K0D832_IGNLU|nr:hypothetical protein ILUMI_09959 [Ignelater luminosus]